jgi:tetratricopeptide (TPR) repeat protein
MRDQDLPQEKPGLVQAVLPWLATGVMLGLYLATLNRWVSVASLPVVAKITGWDWWMLSLQAPLHYLVTWPFRMLPAAWQPVSLNVFAAACAAAALGLLARSVALLPHDRTRDQRQREPSEFSLLTLSASWLPPVFAVLACGLQLTFWEHATAATGESFNLLLFAYIVRCLLEYRIDERDGWLFKAALVYGLAVTNNWAMIGFFPLLVGAILWIRGASFFNVRFLTTLAVCGAAGLLLYLVLPLVELTQAKSEFSFWQLMKTQIGHQKMMLGIFPKYIVLLCGLTSVLPVIVIGVRWPSSLGDTSIIGALLSQFMFRVVHLLFLAACLWVMFDPPFSPRELGYGLPFLPFYYLGALSIGYFSGYFLLLGSPERERHRHRVSPTNILMHRLLFGAVWIALVAVPAGLIHQNLDQVRLNSGHTLKQLGRQLLQSLPARPTLVLSDEPLPLLLFQAACGESGQARFYVPIDTRSLSADPYLRMLHARFPQQWPDYVTRKNPDASFDAINLVAMLAQLSRSNEVYYLHPTVSYYAEGFISQPQGIVQRMIPYDPAGIFLPRWTADELRTNQQYWTQLRPYLETLDRQVRQDEVDNVMTDVRYVAKFYSRALNRWGADLQRHGQWDLAGPWFQLATEINPHNVVATVNAQYNAFRQKPGSQGFKVDPAVENKLQKARSWQTLVREHGPFDEPGYCQKVGEDFATPIGNLPAFLRQAAQSFQRVLELDPSRTDTAIWLGNIYLKGRRPQESLDIIRQIRQRQDQAPLSVNQRAELVRLEAWCLYAQTNLAAAEQVLAAAQKEFPSDVTLPETWFQINLMAGQFTNALAAIEQQLKLEPNNTKALLNQGALCIQLKDYARSIPPLTQVLQKEPRNQPALMNRAIANLQSGNLDEAEKDYLVLLEIEPDFHSALYGLGEIADRRKDSRKAIKYFELFLKNAPRGIVEIQAVEQRLKTLKGGS